MARPKMSDLVHASQSLAEAAENGRWNEAARQAWLRADLLDGLRDEPVPPRALRAAHAAGERARAAVAALRASLQTELVYLRAARRSARVWRPYRESAGGTLDVSS